MKIQSWSIACRSALTAAALLFAAPLAAQDNTEVLNEGMLQILGIEKDHFADSGALSGASGENIKAAKRLMTEGVQEMQRGNADGALSKFKDAKEKDPALSQPNLYLARLCFATNNQEVVNAGRAFLERAAAEKDSLSPEPHLLLAKLALNENRLSDARLQFQEAMTRLTNNDEALGWSPSRKKDFTKEIYAGLASAYEKLQAWDLAKAQLETWEKLSQDNDDKDAVVHLRMGQLLFMSGVDTSKPVGQRITDAAVDLARNELKKAYEAADKVGEKDEDKVKAILRPELLLLDMLTNIDEIEKAKAEIAKLDADADALNGDPNEGARTWQAVAQWYLRRGEFAQATKYAEEAKKLDSDSAAIDQLQAMAAFFSGNTQAARDAFEKMYQKNPADFFASNNLALLLAESVDGEGNPIKADQERAAAIAEVNARAHQQTQANAESLATAGWVLHKLGRNVEAAQIFARFEQTQNLQITADTAYYMARVFNALKAEELPDANARAQAQVRARQLLEQALGTTGAFRYRKQADDWYLALTGERFKKKAPPASSTPPLPASTPTSTAPKDTTPPATNPTPPATNPTPPADGAGT